MLFGGFERPKKARKPLTANEASVLSHHDTSIRLQRRGNDSALLAAIFGERKLAASYTSLFARVGTGAGETYRFLGKLAGGSPLG
jgi:hypothetical protein